MLLENELVPFEPRPLLGERLLVLAPHPDDEALGCGGLIALHAAERRQIAVVVATDGAGADNAGSDLEAYVARRERETIEGLSVLGTTDPPIFFRLRDRHLQQESAALEVRLRQLFGRFRPDLVVAPSPVEIHPDHVALAFALIELVRGSELPPGLVPEARIAFYEVSQPIRPNRLVDITAVAEKKAEAAARHASQIGIREYGRFARGLNDYRAMSLPREVTSAEGYWCATAGELRTMPFGALRDALSPAWQGPEDAMESVGALADELRRRAGECAALEGLLEEHREAVGRQTETINDLFGEIDRLNGLVDTMKKSKRWKLHEALGRLTGRG
ncbi:MAG: PIG-L deacetylase family protein [Thermoanaerobaculia bacterium]|jgi:LmbE family N-acetylglucosaminyl deacetylase